MAGIIWGLIFYELGNKAIQDFDFRELAEESLVFLRDQTRLACHLGVLDASPPASIWRKKKARMRLSFAAGRKRLSLHSSSLGKVLLAWLPEDHIHAL
ncbi:hypothetical protein ACLB1M_33600 [Escherichia coli]